MGCTKLRATMRGAKFQQVKKKLRRILQESEKGGNAIMHQAVQWVAQANIACEDSLHPDFSQNFILPARTISVETSTWEKVFLLTKSCSFHNSWSLFVWIRWYKLLHFFLQISVFLNFRLKLYQKTVYLLLVFVCLCLGASVCLSATMHWWARAVRPR